MITVYAVMDDTDSYGPRLQAIYATREIAERAAEKMNLEAPGLPQKDWPNFVQEHAVQPNNE